MKEYVPNFGKMVPSGDVLIDRGIPAVSALSLFQVRSISDGIFLVHCTASAHLAIWKLLPVPKHSKADCDSEAFP